MNELRKYLSTIKVELAKQLAYKLNFLLLVIGPVAVMFFIKLNLWWSIFQVRSNAPVAGYTFGRMVEYQSYVLVVTLLAQCYANHNISEDIRFGRISAFLLYPIGFMQYHFGAFSAAQLLNLVSAGAVLLTLLVSQSMPIPGLLDFSMGILMTLLVSLQWFFFWFSLSSMAFWLDESWVVRVLFTIVVRFLSGSILPLELFPETARILLQYSPFPYLTYVPVQLFMGSYQGNFLSAVGITLGWTIFAGLVASSIWRRGVRLYSAAGI